MLKLRLDHLFWRAGYAACLFLSLCALARPLPAATTYTITASAGSGGSLSPAGAVSVAAGATQVFAVTPSAGYAIQDVTVDGKSWGAVPSFTCLKVSANHTLTASFKKVFVLTASAGSFGSISPAGAVQVDAGSTKVFTITPEAGCQVTSVKVDGKDFGVIPSFTFLKVSASHTITASFKKVFLIATSVYPIGNTIPSGSLSPSGNVQVDAGSDKVFTITPDRYSLVDHVWVDNKDMGAIPSFTFLKVSASHTLVVYFKWIEVHTIQADAGARGSISPAGNVTLQDGMNQTFTFTPDPQFAVADVSVDGKSFGAIPAFTFLKLSTPHTIHVEFKRVRFVIHASAGPGGSISPSGEVEVALGGEQNFTITPASGFLPGNVHLDYDGKVIPGVPSYTFSQVTADHDIEATFRGPGVMSDRRDYFTATLLHDGKVLVVGGQDLFSADLYDPATGYFTPTGPLHVARFMHTATLLPSGKVLIAGGTGFLDYSPIEPMPELYDPATGTFTAIGPLLGPRWNHAATLLPDGKVLFTGGQYQYYPTRDESCTLWTIERYDPATGLSTLASPYIAARQCHDSTLLPDGRVLLTGGIYIKYGYTESLTGCESYDPATGVCADAGWLTAGYSNATLLGNGKLLITGEPIAGNNPYSTEIYDPLTGSCTRTLAPDTARHGHTATLMPSGKVLLAGGSDQRNPGATASVESYDPATGTLSSEAPLAMARIAHTATLMPSGKVLFVGGQGTEDSAELYDPQTNMHAARQLHTATKLASGQVLVAGGSDGLGGYLAGTELYDPASQRFTAAGPLVTGRDSHTATRLADGRVLLAGGRSGATSYLASTELFDPATGTCVPASAMASARMAPSATLLQSGKVLIVGGYNGAYLASAELYDPATGLFTPAGPMHTGRNSHCALLLASGQVLILGGYSAHALDSAELYDPASNSFTLTGSLATARAHATATLLPGGQVLVSGGWNGAYLTGSELYDPATGRFTATGSLATQRANHTATLRPDGKVLVAGGYYQADATYYPPFVELYDPATGAFTTLGPLAMPRRRQRETLLDDGRILLTGGFNGVCLGSAELR